jgi:hypothetical protein
MAAVSRYERPRFRITTSPSVVVAPVAVTAPVLVAGPFLRFVDVLDFVDENVEITRGATVERARALRSAAATELGGQLFARTGGDAGCLIAELGATHLVDAPPDLFLRRLLGDFDDLVHLLRTYGPVRVPAGLVEEAAALVPMPGGTRHLERQWRQLCAELHGKPGDPDVRGTEIPLVAESVAMPQGLLLTLHQFSLRQQMLVLTLYRAVTLTALQLPALNADGGEEVFDRLRAYWEELRLPAPATPDQAAVTASRVLNLTTVGLGPRLQLIDPDAGQPDVGAPLVDLLGVLAAQVLAHLSQGVPLRRCAHDPCGRWFTHQQGRARYGQHRATGVRYCTAGCARLRRSSATAAVSAPSGPPGGNRRSSRPAALAVTGTRRRAPTRAHGWLRPKNSDAWRRICSSRLETGL